MFNVIIINNTNIYKSADDRALISVEHQYGNMEMKLVQTNWIEIIFSGFMIRMVSFMFDLLLLEKLVLLLTAVNLWAMNIMEAPQLCWHSHGKW